FQFTSDDGSWELGGRAHVFDGMPYALYLPRDSSYRVEGDGELAVCGARCERRREPVPAERLLVVEVFTPSGNWSSYPPHKHDEDDPPGEVVLEETYYFRTPAPEAFAVQRLYSPRHGLDLTE